MIGCQAKVSARGLVETEVYLGNAIAPGSFAWLVPLRGSTALAGMVSQERGGGTHGPLSRDASRRRTD